MANVQDILNKTALDPRDKETADLMKNIQGNILKGHGRNHTANIFLQFIPGKILEKKDDGTTPPTADEKLPLIKDYLGTLAEDHLTNCYKQLKEREIFKRNNIPGGLNLFMMLTKAGLETLGVASIAGLKDNAFQVGMKKRQSVLNDPDAHTWDGGFKTDDKNPKEIHCLIILADDDERRLCLTAKEIINKLVDDDGDTLNPLAKILTVEYGHTIRNANGDGLEHNGYVDGISQPLFLKDEIEEYKEFHDLEKCCKETGKTMQYDPVFPLSQVLVKDPLVTGIEESKNAYGSYFVFRKLEQNVRKFKQDEAGIGKSLFPATKDREKREIAGAMLVGRFEDGTPVQLQDEDGLYGSGAFNNFNYENDPLNSQDPSDGKCPFFAHIRRTNGRTQADRDATMARRGIPFGRRDVSTETDPVPEQSPESGVGLLFMSYQKSLVDQFEEIQKAVNTAPNGGLDIDPIIGQQFVDDEDKSGNKKLINGGEDYKFPLEWGHPTSKSGSHAFKNHITMKGGEYFFAPSIPFLESLKK